MIVPRYYEDTTVLHENTMPNRSYFIPASRRMDDLVEHREHSDRFQLLNGDWKFRYYASIFDLQDQFFAPDYDSSGFDILPVPSVWQMHGYDLNHYINSRYPFPADPPYVPQDNPCGAYIHSFTYHADPAAPQVYLNFEGVDSCYFVWLNGRYVGYSQVAHSTSEFDVTDHLTEGENTLAVLVLKWCDGSYLECQDKFRWSGIFRDVYLLKRPKQMLFDYFVQTRQEQGSGAVVVQAKPLPVDTPVKLSLYNADGVLVASAVTADTDTRPFTQAAELPVASPRLWSAEQPYLYTLVLELPGETVVEQVGFRSIRATDSVVYINDVPLKFYGVNRHESNPVTGYVMSMEQMVSELKLLKAHNCNAIRTSHYPCHPVFYQLCDRYGFYVIDEADVEAHGAEYCWHDNKLGNTVKFNMMVADAPEFVGPIVDRVQRLVQRDKNRPCAVIWSMGNESAYGRAFEMALAWTKAFDPTRLTHYESARYVNTDRKYDYSNLDLFSRMYASLEEMQAYIDKQPDKPFIQCEYSHAMGNGPGDLEDYFHMFHSDPRFCGGFVWEFCDHAVYKGQAPNGKPMYWYGGDHNEPVHDGNFCMDGLVYPDRTPHTGLLEFKNVNRPIRASYDAVAGVVTFTSYLDFLDASQTLRVGYELTCDGRSLATGELALPALAPHTSVQVPLALEVPAQGCCWLKLNYSTAVATQLLEAGHLVGFDEFRLPNADGRNSHAVALAAAGQGSKLKLEQDDAWITVTGADFRYVCSKRTGLWHSLAAGGRQLLDKPMELNIWRAPTDNDRNIKGNWFLAKHHMAYARAYSAFAEEADGAVRIECEMSVGGMTTRPVVRMTTVWTVEPSGIIRMELEGEMDPNFLMLPRFGLRLFLPAGMDQVEYFGLGPVESYVDKRRAAWHGKFASDVQSLHEDYLYPQENGSHCDCSYVTVSGDGLCLSAFGEESFSFNASPYTQEELTAKAHSYELEPCGSTVLCLDYAQNGIGSNSCGPQLSEKYRLAAESFTFRLGLRIH